MMKAKLCTLYLLCTCLLLAALPACAAQVITLDEVLFVDLYGCAVETPQGNTLLALALREKENKREGENLNVACLRCLGADGETLWEHRDATSDNNIYVQPAVAADGSVLAAVHHYESSGTGLDEYVLRRFSPQGELLAEVPLPEHDGLFLNMVWMRGALCAQYRVSQTGADDVLEFVCFDETLQPVATLRGCSAPTARWAGGWLTFDRVGSGPLSATLLNDTGEALWTKELAQLTGTAGWRDAYAENGDLLVMIASYDDQARQPTMAEVLRCTPQGEVTAQTALALPKLEGNYTLCDLRADESGYQVLAVARTETRVRLLRFDEDGQCLGSKDANVEDDVYYTACFAALGSEAYICAASRNEHDLVRLFPMNELKGE